METAIKKAIEGGWSDDNFAYGMKEGEKPSNGDPKVGGWFYGRDIYLDPLFWQALGKAEGWGLTRFTNKEMWKIRWHEFIDWIAEGKEIDLFFKELFK